MFTSRLPLCRNLISTYSLHAAKQCRIITRSYASRIEIPFTPPPFPVIDSCPSPSCQCRETPSGLDIEREHTLNGSMASYAEQILVSTGKSDWTSKIEDDQDGELVRHLKSFLGPKGKYSDPFHNVLLTASSFPQPATDSTTLNAASSASAFLLPSFQYIPSIPMEPAGVEAFIQAFVLPSQLHQVHERLNREQQNVLIRQSALQQSFVGARRAKEIVILICSHASRDSRCGVLGPILKAEFEEKLERQNMPLLISPPVSQATEVHEASQGYIPHARVGLISHIGGHKWAGNVIIYIPPEFSDNPLAGCGIWYGRVGPEHVEGIVEKTVLGGKVIRDMFRGGIDQDRRILRL